MPHPPLAWFALVLVAAATAQDQHWPQFRGPSAHGVAEGFATPVRWDVAKGENVAWKASVPGLGHSSPVVWGDKVYVTTAVPKEGEAELSSLYGSPGYGKGESVLDEKEQAFVLLCLDARTGAILWQRTAHEGVPRVKRHPKSSHANPTPCCDETRVVASFGSEGLFCYDHAGKLIWKRDLGVLNSGAPGYKDKDGFQWGFASSPVLFGGRVYVQCDHEDGSFVAALDAANGQDVWRMPRQENSTWCTPTVHGTQLVCNGYQHIGGYDLATGQEVWKLTGGGDVPVPTPVVMHDLIFLTSAHGRARPIRAVRVTAQGTLDPDPEKEKQIAWVQPRDGIYMQTPLVYGDLLYCCADGGSLSCYDAKTGERIYRERLGAGKTGFSGSAVAADGKLYFSGEAGDVHVVKAGRSFEVMAVNDMGETLMATPAISRGTLFFRTQHHVVAVREPSAQAGQQAAAWPQFRGPGSLGLAAAGEKLPAELGDHSLLWKCAIGEGHSSPCIWGDRVFLTARTEGGLETLAIDRGKGDVLWRRKVEVAELEKHHEQNSPASPTPTCDGARVLVYFGSFGLLAYDLDGQELWRRELPRPANEFGTAASPVVANGLLVFNHDSNKGSWLEAIAPATGKTVWRTERTGFKSGWSTPVVWQRDGRHEVLVYGAFRLVAYDLADGKELWSAPGVTDEPCTTPVTGDGLVFLTSYNMRTNPEVIGLPKWAQLVKDYDTNGNGRLDKDEAAANQSVLSRHDADGEGDHPLRMFFKHLDKDKDGELAEPEWQKLIDWLNTFEFANAILAIRPGSEDKGAEIAWQHGRGVPECPSALHHEGRVFTVANGGLVTCLDARTGAVRYEGRIDARGPCYASPVAGDGKIYTASARGVLNVLAAGDELRVLSRLDLGERIMATPALVDGKVYVRTAKHLWAFGG